ncbi:MAG: peptide-modifying radical SAM enzyme CbpB [Syntrophobacteraceae bacterium]
MTAARILSKAAIYANTGYGPQFSVLDVGLTDQVAVIEPDLAFWALVDRDAIESALAGGLIQEFENQAKSFKEEMDRLRFGLKPSAVYFNPTERCNFNCGYCYLPEEMRRNGRTMSVDELCGNLGLLLERFAPILPEGTKPQVIFHGSEPLLAKEAVFAGIKRFHDKFHFGIQTNAALLDDEAIAFLTGHQVGIGISLDGPTAEIANAIRMNWAGTGFFDQVMSVIPKLVSYPAFNVITTVTRANVHALTDMVELLHGLGVRVGMLNPVRCTQKGGQDLKPDNAELAENFCRALDRAGELYDLTGQKLVIANFANVLAGVAGPTGRKLMCDISPCGGGRCFFAVSAAGEAFPCSEFIGFSEFCGGNVREHSIDEILESEPFKAVTGRKIESIEPCSRCAIRHFCGAPCPAEIFVVSGTLDAPSPYCQFYEEQVRYAFRVIAKSREAAYLWDGWEDETEESFVMG